MQLKRKIHAALNILSLLIIFKNSHFVKDNTKKRRSPVRQASSSLQERSSVELDFKTSLNPTPRIGSVLPIPVEVIKDIEGIDNHR